MEQERIQRRLLEKGVILHTQRTLTGVTDGGVTTACVFTGRDLVLDCDTAVFVTARLPNEGLYLELMERRQRWQDAGLVSVRAVGDAFAPGTIASAVWDGRRFAEELDGRDEPALFRRNIASLPA
jgi:dimethylamine/trimethylamine dehydrogenase